MKSHEYYMAEALKEAKKSLLHDEVPVGCVIVLNDKIIARSHNLKETKQDIFAHSEVLAIKKAQKKLQNWRLIDCKLYVTLEPCLMCSGAIMWSRIPNVFFGAYDPKNGALISAHKSFNKDNLNHYPTCVGGILQEECSQILKDFFKNKRKGRHD